MAELSRLFKPGFRLDAIDTVVLVAGAAGAVLLSQIEWWMGLIVGLVVGHFFMFCNVFRVSRPLELCWSVTFIALAGSTIVTGHPGWAVTLSGTLAATLLILVIQVRRPSYHGIGWRRLNPKLLEWWDSQCSERDTR